MFSKKDCTFLGKITRTHGVSGQVILATDVALDREIIKEPILINIDGGLVPFYLDTENGLKYRDHQSYLIQLDHIKTREEAEAYTNKEVYLLHPIKVDCSIPNLPQQKSLLKDFSLYDSENNLLGEIEEILDFSGNTLVRIYVQDKEVLLPFTEDHIISWNAEQRTIHLDIPDGLLDI